MVFVLFFFFVAVFLTYKMTYQDGLRNERSTSSSMQPMSGNKTATTTATATATTKIVASSEEHKSTDDTYNNNSGYENRHENRYDDDDESCNSDNGDDIWSRLLNHRKLEQHDYYDGLCIKLINLLLKSDKLNNRINHRHNLHKLRFDLNLKVLKTQVNDGMQFKMYFQNNYNFIKNINVNVDIIQEINTYFKDAVNDSQQLSSLLINEITDDNVAAFGYILSCLRKLQTSTNDTRYWDQIGDQASQTCDAHFSNQIK